MSHWPFRVPALGGKSQALKVIAWAAIVVGVGALAQQRMSLGWHASKPGPLWQVGVPGRRNHGSLVICGGGGLPDAVRARFIDLAGGSRARIVVIPTASRFADSPDVSKTLDAWKKKGMASVTLLHTRSRARANDPAFTRSLKDATGVWFGGGTQSALTDAYLNTEVERQLQALLDRGGVIGGTSAGAAVMTRVMIASGRTEVTEGQGFDFLPGAVIDQHFLKRNRAWRLRDVLERHADLIGFGIDERTALVVNGERLSVLGDSYVIACVPQTADRPARFEILKDGDSTDLAALHGDGVAVVTARALDTLAAVPGG